MNFRKILASASAILALLLAACGGGGADGGIGGTGNNTGVAYGTITGFGSVWVNGVRYSSTGSTIRLDDTTVAEAQLRVGMIARVDGSVSNATAATITVDSALKGRVEQVLDANRIVVMGQTVQIDNQTVFDNGVRPIAGNYVEVHGLPVADGVIAAGYIEVKSVLATPPFVVTGLVRAHNAAASTLSVGTLNVAYSGALTGDMPAGSWVGLLVEIKGSTCAGTPVCATLTASKIEPGGLNVTSIAQAEVEGFVTRTSADGFMLGAQQVAVTASTVYENGVAADVQVGAKLEAEGSISGGVLTATKVSLRDNVRIEADVFANGASGLSLAGLPGVTVQINSLTRLSGVASASLIAAPNHLRIRGRAGAGNTVYATEVELRSVSSDTRVILHGPVSAFASPRLTILGVVIDTSSVTEFRNLADALIDRNSFFGALAVGSVAKGRGTLSGAAVTWTQMERED